MGVSDTIRHRFDTSLNSAARISHRTGDNENGDELLDLIPAGAWDVADQMIEREERPERIKFLKQFFSLLKQTLTPEEFKFVKLRFTKKKTDKQIATWLGFPSAAGAFREIQKKLQGEERTIRHIVERSEWEGAEAFATALTSGINTLIKDEETLQAVTRHGAGFAAIEQATEYINRLKGADERAKTHRKFFMRGVYYGTKFKEETHAERKARTLAKIALWEALSFIDVIKYIVNKKVEANYTAREIADFCIHWLEKIAEGLEKIDGGALVPKESIDEHIFETLAKKIIAEDMDESKTFSERCAEKCAERAQELTGVIATPQTEPAQAVAVQ